MTIAQLNIYTPLLILNDRVMEGKLKAIKYYIITREDFLQPVIFLRLY